LALSEMMSGGVPAAAAALNFSSTWASGWPGMGITLMLGTAAMNFSTAAARASASGPVPEL
jgi:hypothetical protein